jgi:glycerol-3-phosphate dehydrogenase
MKRNPEQLASNTFDMIVIGGGIYGACIVWDAALRGLSVALIERNDFGQETSANSLKTVHGGLRYLQDADINLVRRMIYERSTYLRIAPHLVHPLACLTPTYSQLMKGKLVMGAALKLNDLAGFDRNRGSHPEKIIQSSHLVSRQDCLKVLPELPDENVTGGAIWYDAQIYDTERLTLSFIRSAATRGALVCNYLEAVGLLKQGNQVSGVKARDTLSGDDFDIRARVVVNAAGPWVDQILWDATPQSSDKKFNQSLAMNFITRKVFNDYAVGLPSWQDRNYVSNGDEKESHMLFVSPWRGKSLVGTFHSHFHGEPDQFELTEELIEGMLTEANSAYPSAELTREDISFIHHGFLPEELNSEDAEVKLVRKGRVYDHRNEDGIQGLISVIGVKYTTARHLAERAVNLAYDYLGSEPPDSKTDSTQIHGGQVNNFSDYLIQTIKEDSSELNPGLIDHLVRSYGSDYHRVRDLIDDEGENRGLDLSSPQVLKAMISIAVQDEMAIKLSDVIFRRTGIGSTEKPAGNSLEQCAEFMAGELGWSETEKENELDEVRTIYDNHRIG